MSEQMMWQPDAERIAVANLMRGEKPERLNYAQNLLHRRDYDAALVFWGEDKLIRRMGRGDLYRRVARLALAMKDEGVVAGDIIAAYMPNLPETVITLLAASSIGAVFTSASPDTGVRDVLDRFAQVAPKLLFVADGYYYDGMTHDSLDEVKAIVAGLPSLKKTIMTRYTRKEGHEIEAIPHAMMLREFVNPYRWQTEIEFVPLPFEHPLCITYLPDTDGVPKYVVHSAGDVLLQHFKEQHLQADVKPGGKLFCLPPCGSMTWHQLVNGLASDATLLLYDGSPSVGGGNILSDYAVAEGKTGTG